MKLSVVYRPLLAVLSLLLITGCTVFADTDLGDRPPEISDCTEGAMRCSTDGSRVEECVCTDDECRFAAQIQCDGSAVCTAGLSSVVCADSCPGGGNEQFFALDSDSDNFPANSEERLSCTSPAAGFRPTSELQPDIDCVDSDSNINPGASESAGNENDENCDGRIACFVDNDRDTFVPFSGNGPISEEIEATTCARNQGYAAVASETRDCDDTNGDINPGADELCNGIDDDCDGNPDVGTGADPDVTQPCFDSAEFGCEADTECVTGTCKTTASGGSEGVCISDTPSCAEYCDLYENLNGSCDFYLPPTIENCGTDCDDPPARELCMAACDEYLNGVFVRPQIELGSYDDDEDDFSIGCRSNFFIDALTSSGADREEACFKGTLTMGGYCQTRKNLGSCEFEENPEPGEIPTLESRPCAFGSACSYTVGLDYSACMPQCERTLNRGGTTEGATVACPVFPDLDSTLTGECLLSSTNTDPSSLPDGVTSEQSIRCIYQCENGATDCNGDLENTDVPAEQYNAECGRPAGAAPAQEYTCLAETESFPPLLCEADFRGGERPDLQNIEDYGAAELLQYLESARTEAALASELDITRCFRSPTEEAPNAPQAADCRGCDDCLLDFQACIEDRCDAQCAPLVGTGNDYDTERCVCCLENQRDSASGRTCVENLRWCSGLSEDHFSGLVNNPLGCPAPPAQPARQ